MPSPSVTVLRSVAKTERPPTTGATVRLVEATAQRRAPARGALIGILLGAALWGAILLLTGVIKI